jgi:hypothetical protein
MATVDDIRRAADDGEVGTPRPKVKLASGMAEALMSPLFESFRQTGAAALATMPRSALVGLANPLQAEVQALGKQLTSAMAPNNLATLGLKAIDESVKRNLAVLSSAVAARPPLDLLPKVPTVRVDTELGGYRLEIERKAKVEHAALATAEATEALVEVAQQQQESIGALGDLLGRVVGVLEQLDANQRAMDRANRRLGWWVRIGVLWAAVAGVAAILTLAFHH